MRIRPDEDDIPMKFPLTEEEQRKVDEWWGTLDAFEELISRPMPRKLTRWERFKRWLLRKMK